MKISDKSVILSLLAAVVALLAFAAGAQAATLTLKCSGKGPISKWVPEDGGYNVTPEKELEIKAAANGKFKIPNLTTKTEATVSIEAVGDADLEISPVTQEVNFRRQVTATAKVLGGGKVKVTVQGAEPPFKIGITDESGYFVSGGTARKANKAGTAVFNLGNQHGTFNIYLDAGELGDLYYFDAKSFKY